MTYRELFDKLLRMNNRQLNQKALFHHNAGKGETFEITEIGLNEGDIWISGDETLDF